MGLRYEAWSPPWDPDGLKRKVAMLPAIDNTGQGTIGFLSLGGDSSVDISLANFDRLDDVVSDTETSLITVYDCAKDGTNTIIDEWIADRVPQDYVPSKQVKLSGPRLLREAFDKALVYAFDYPKSPSVTRDHIWGKNQDDDSTGLIRNGTFEDVPLPNGGFEDGNAGHWQGTEDDGNLIGNGAISAVSSATDARTGSWYGSVNPLAQGGGARRSISGLVPGENYTITGFINESSGSGDRLRAGVIGASTATHTNAYEEPNDPDIPGIWWAEIGNATQGNGASDGTYQSVTLTFKPESDSVELVIIYDDVNDRTFRIDDWSISGDNVGLDPWVPFANYNGKGTEINIGRHSTSRVRSGGGSCEIQGVDGPYYDGFGRIGYGTFGISQDIRMVPGRLYTFTAWVQHAGNGDNGANELVRIILNRKTPKGAISETLTGDFVPGPGSYYMANKTVLVPENTWTKIQMTVYADVSEISAQIRYAGTSQNNVDLGTFTSPNIWIDDVSIHEGLPATTIGDIWTRLLDDCTLNHANDTRGTVLEWIDYSSFDAVNDSNGNPWNEDIPFLARWGSTMSHVLDDTIDRGYEMELVRKATPSGGKTHDFHLYNPGGRDNAPNTAIGSHQPLLGGDSLRRNPAYTSTLVASPEGSYTEDSDATSLANFGRMEKFEMDSEASGPVSRQLLADNLLNYEQANRKAVRFKVVESDGVPRPGVDYKPGDTVAMSMPPGLAKEDRRVQSFDYVNSHPTQYVVVGSRVMQGEAAAFDLLERLWRRLQRPGETKDPELGLGLGGDAGFFAIDVAASDAPSWEKAVARYQCDGVDDHVEIVAAMDESFNEGTNNSEVSLSSGTFWVDEGLVYVAESSVMRGQGQGSTFIRNQTVGTLDDTPSNSRGTFLISVQHSAELCDLSIWTDFAFQGTCIVVANGWVHDVHHLGGYAQRFIYIRGSQGPFYNISSYGTYNQVPVADRRACIETDENWFSLTGAYLGVHGTAIWIGDHQGTASITGITIEKRGAEPAIFMGDVGYAALGDIAIRDFAGEGPGIIVESPFFVSLSNINIQGTTVGLAAAEGFWGPSLLDIDNFIVKPFVSGIDFYLDDGSAFARDVSIKGFRCDGSQTGKGAGWGIRMGGAFGNGKYIISDFDIEGMDEDGILLLNGPIEAAVIHDGVLTDIGKHGVVLDGVIAQVHDVFVNGAGLAAANTYDAFHLKGSIEQPRIQNNKISGEAQLRYGVNISVDTVKSAIVVGNSGEDASGFGTDAINDQGRETQLTFPGDPTYGDNFFTHTPQDLIKVENETAQTSETDIHIPHLIVKVESEVANISESDLHFLA